jgi:hypothetical protein
MPNNLGVDESHGHCERAPCPLAARVVPETGATRSLLDFVRGPPPGGMDCFASPTRNSEHSVRGSPFCHTRESGYPAGRDAATRGLRLAGMASRRNSVSVVVSWMPAFAGMTRGKRPIQAPVGYSKGTGRRPYELAMTERARADWNSQSTSPRQAALSIFWAPP